MHAAYWTQPLVSAPLPAQHAPNPVQQDQFAPATLRFGYVIESRVRAAMIFLYLSRSKKIRPHSGVWSIQNDVYRTARFLSLFLLSVSLHLPGHVLPRLPACSN